MILFSIEQLSKMLPNATKENIQKFYQPLIETCSIFKIDTPERIAAFIAQLAHESGSLQYVKEIATGEAYDVGRLAERLGNTPEDDGDGEKYKGRGLIQITGLSNYKEIAKTYNIDCVNHPEILEQPKYAALVSGNYWHTRKLNVFADSGNFKEITRKINGGYNGLEDRIKHWERCKLVMGVK